MNRELKNIYVFIFGNDVPLFVCAGFEPVPNLQPQSPKYWDYRYEPLHLLDIFVY